MAKFARGDDPLPFYGGVGGKGSVLEATWLVSAQKDSSRWFVLGSLTLATFMSTLDVSIVNVALAPISRDFGIAVDSLEWIAITYSLTLVALTPISGRISDMLGRTRIFTLGFVGFIIASLLCSLAWNFPSLVFFRALQGVSAAMFQGNNQAIITAIFPPDERGRAFGINSVAVGAGIVSGPVIGGLLTAWLGWRSIFWVNVPVGAIGFVVGRALLPADEPRRGKFTFDYRGAALFVGGIVPFMFGLGSVANKSWFSPVVIGPVLAGAALLVLFARSQVRGESDHHGRRGAVGQCRRAPNGETSGGTWSEIRGEARDETNGGTRGETSGGARGGEPEPLMPPVIFQSPGVALGLTAAFISFTAGNMATFLTPYVMQEGLGFAVSQAGLIMTAAPLAMLVSAPVSGYLSDKFGPRPFTVAGLAAMAVALFLLSRLGTDWTAADLYWRLAVQGVGWGLFNSPNWATIMGAVPPTVAGVTGGINATTRNLGNTAAVAFAAAYFHRQSMGMFDPDILVDAYRSTMVLAAALAAVGIAPAMLRRLPDVSPERGAG